MLRILLVLCLLFLTVLALSLAKVRVQTGKQEEEIQGPRAECVLGSMAVPWPCSIVLTINTCTDTLWKELQVCEGAQVSEANCSMLRSPIWMVGRRGHHSMHLLGFPDMPQPTYVLMN